MPKTRISDDANVAQLKRLLAIVPMARRKTGVSLEKLRALFGCDIDTLFDDVRLLIMCGVPPYGPSDYIQAYIENGRLYMNFANQFARPVRLAAGEYAALTCVLDYAAGVLGDDSRRVADSMLSKLSGRCVRSDHPDGVSHTILSSAKPRRDRMALVKDCIASNTKLDIEYYSASSGALRRRVVHPYAVVVHSYHWYVIAYDEMQGEVRVFRGDRICSARVLRESFSRPEGFDARRFLGPRVFAGERAGITMKVLFVPGYARFAAERFPPDTLRKRRDGSVVLTMRVDGIPWAARWVLKHGRYARALAPKELVEEVKKQCDEMLQLYE